MKTIKKISLKPALLHGVMFGKVKEYKTENLVIKLSKDKMLLEIYVEVS